MISDKAADEALTLKLRDILSSVEEVEFAKETPVPVNNSTTVATYAGGVQLMQILDLPQGATPERFKLPPPTEAETEALEMIYRAEMRKEMYGIPYIDQDSHAYEAPSTPAEHNTTDGAIDAFAAFAKLPAPPPIHTVASIAVPPDYDAPEQPITTLVTDSYVPFANTITAGRNAVPTGCYVLKPCSVLRLVGYASDTWVESPHAVSLVADAVSAQRTVCAFASLNVLPVRENTVDETPYFYGMIYSSMTKTPKVVRILMSDIESVRATSEYALARAFTDAAHGIYHMVVSTSPDSSPVPLALTNTPLSLLEPEHLPQSVSEVPYIPLIDGTSTILPLLLRILPKSDVNEMDKHSLLVHLAAIESLDEARQKHLVAIAGIAAKYN